MKHVVLASVSLSLLACADVSDLPMAELPQQITTVFKGEDDGRTDIIDCLKHKGDIVQAEATGEMRCRSATGELIELRDLR